MISIAIDNGRNNTVGGGCYSAHQAASKFAEHNIDMVGSSQMPDSSWCIWGHIRRLDVSLKLTVSFLIEFFYE